MKKSRWNSIPYGSTTVRSYWAPSSWACRNWFCTPVFVQYWSFCVAHNLTLCLIASQVLDSSLEVTFSIFALHIWLCWAERWILSILLKDIYICICPRSWVSPSRPVSAAEKKDATNTLIHHLGMVSSRWLVFRLWQIQSLAISEKELNFLSCQTRQSFFPCVPSGRVWEGFR